MNSMIFKATFCLAGGLLVATTTLGASRSGKGRAIGAGLSFPSSNQSLVVNSAALPENGATILQGLWGFETNEAAASLVGSQSQIGWGLGWKDSGDNNIFDAGFGLNLGTIALGANVYTSDFDGIDGDISAIIDLKKIRLAFVGRGVQGGLDGLDASVGFELSKLLISLDASKELPFEGTDPYRLDASFAYDVGQIAIGFGYDFWLFEGSMEQGDLHADLSVTLANNFAIEGHYRLTPLYASAIPNWSLGARLMF